MSIHLNEHPLGSDGSSVDSEQLRLAPFWVELGAACSRLRDNQGEAPGVDLKEDERVISGKLVEMKFTHGVFRFWCGINVSRIFFVIRAPCPVQRAKKVLGYCFGGAQSVGWRVGYEKSSDGCLISAVRWVEEPLAIAKSDGAPALSGAGMFWAGDTALMAQSWVKGCQRHGLEPHPSDPAPF